MDAQRWRAAQIALREAMRAERDPVREHGPTAPVAGRPPLVSVIVVCFNAGDVLERCLTQLRAQDYPDYEVIVVDDGSSDDTLAVVERASNDGELTIVRSARNRGCPHARNLGVERARGEVLAFIDADGYAASTWLSRVVDALGTDDEIGAVASTVFFADSPLVLNGAGGTVNRQGWAADLSMNEAYEHARIATEALYPMGCGMAIRSRALERVGPFDDRMLNYYDDVDYGIRLWRAGFRVRVAPDAWIDHGFDQATGEQTNKRLLCERHRMRVVLQHAPARELGRWGAYEARALRAAPASRRALKLRAVAWNARHLPSVLATRARLRRAPRAPERLIDPSWGDAFPVGVPPRSRPRPEQAGAVLDMADARSEDQLVYGWFPTERVGGQSHRWAAVQAAALIGLKAPARMLRLDCKHVPVDAGGADVRIRQVGTPEPSRVVWSAHLPWQYAERTVESHLLDLPAGDYEVIFSAPRGWTDPPRETRTLSVALARMTFEESYAIVEGGLDLDSPEVERQLLKGWYEAESSAERSYRWAGERASAVVRLSKRASKARIVYRFPPGETGSALISVRPVDAEEASWSTRLRRRAGEWEEQTLALDLGPGDYVVSLEAETTWSNPIGGDTSLPPENRSLGFALSSLRFGQGDMQEAGALV